MSDDKSTTSPLVLDLQYHTIAGVWTQTVDARKLHQGLAIATRWDLWITRRIDEYGFSEGSDFLLCSEMNMTTSRPRDVYLLTLDMAKELCMVERSPKGRQARQYFIACEKALQGGHSTALVQALERFDARLAALEAQAKGVGTPDIHDSLTPGGQLPPPTPRPREHAEVSWHMAAVWRLLRQCDEWLSNKEIAARIGIAARTVRAHTRYFRQLGLIEVHEYFPHHLHRVALDADLRHPGVYQRLEEITALIEARRRP